MNPIEAQLTELHIEQMGGRCGISYDGKTYVERSTSPAGVAIMSNIWPEAVWYSTCNLERHLVYKPGLGTSNQDIYNM